jgi:type VI secretion system protein VasG
MSEIDIKTLIERLNEYSRKMFEESAGHCLTAGHYEVTVDHFIFQCLDDNYADLHLLLQAEDVDKSHLKKELQSALSRLKSGNSGRPVFSMQLMQILESAWLTTSLEFQQKKLRSGLIFLEWLTVIKRQTGADYYPSLKDLSPAALKEKFFTITAGSIEDPQMDVTESQTASGADTEQKTALQQFAHNLTEAAREDKIDPVFGRDEEVRQMIDILARRRKNNPIIVGEPGVGKTAVVEGLACQIITGDVPPVLQGVDLWSLDLGLLQAGASVKGQFEQRLNAVIEEVKASTKPIIMFIDEAHTLVGAGGAAGGSDAANLLKPALARGELRTIAATTWTEYKKYFEKDPALARRFQVIKVEEPDIEAASLMLRGAREAYEHAHDVYIRDDAVVACVELSARFVSGRQLPDKAVDLMDTACARVKLSLSSSPDSLQRSIQEKAELNRELFALERDRHTLEFSAEERIDAIRERLSALEQIISETEERWKQEKTQVEEVIALRKQLSESPDEDESLNQSLKQKEKDLKALQGKEPLVYYEVTPDLVSKVVSDWTGIPTNNMLQDEAATLMEMDDTLKQRIRGQDYAIDTISRHVRSAKAGLTSPETPMGVFLLVGPSGVGKTETALGLADQLFGGERFVVTVNMSEFQEKHSLSRLIGSPPGYVGYGEGGVLTEAVRQRPYSIVLLDEVEKADLEVMNLFYQVFDKGTLSDGEGRIIDFKNTVVILTSNLATDEITQMWRKNPELDIEDLSTAIRPILNQHFKPALLGRMEVIPYLPIGDTAMQGIVRLKLNKLVKRIQANQNIELLYSDEVVNAIVERCIYVESGARNIDAIINKSLLPPMSNCILQNLAKSEPLGSIHVNIDQGEFQFEMK